jgi:hypothetical protein
LVNFKFEKAKANTKESSQEHKKALIQEIKNQVESNTITAKIH